MTTELRDPDKPAGAVVEVLEDGTAIRNDGRRLKPASQNPWYVLMTVHGEQTSEKIDRDLAARNRRIWNGWACSGLDAAERAALAERMDLAPDDLAPLSDDERTEIDQAFRDRLPDGTDLPAPDQIIDLSEIHFSNPVVLEKWSFSGRASFESATFSGLAFFESATFSGRAFFESATFSGRAFFGSATFSGDAWFESATFSGDAWFESATFSGYAWFESATFSGYADFGSATFSGYAWFGSATFSGDAGFGSATFSGLAGFGSATFSGDASFGSAIFSGRAFFGSATFSGDAGFGSATFIEYADFSDGIFKARTIFEQAGFGGRVPTFYQRQMHQDTAFTTDAALWPQVTADTAAESKRAYTRLRQIMAELHKPDDEHFFFRQEMRCKEFEEDWWNRWPIRIYRWASDYGYSVTRPLAGLALVIAVGWGFLGAHLKWRPCLPEMTACPGPVEAIWQGLGVSFSNTFGFLGFARRFHPDFFTHAPAWIDALAALQTVLGVVLLFFLGLGMRNRFRLK